MVLSLIVPMVSAVFAAVGSVLEKRLVEDISPIELTNLSFLAIILIMVPLMPFFFTISNFQKAVPLIGAIVILDSVANILYFKGLKLGEVTKATALHSLAPLFTAIMTPFILPSQFSLEVFIAASGIAFSLYFLQTSDGVKEFLHSLKVKENYLIILATFILAFSAILVRMTLNDFGVTNSVTLYWIRAIGIFLLITALLRPKFKGFERDQYLLIGYKSVFIVIAWVSMFYALANFNLIFSYALTKTVPLFTMLLAWRQLEEEITIRKTFAIISIIFFIVMVEVI